MKSSVLRTHENCEGSISLTLRIRNSRKPSRMLVRNWKHQLLLRCLARKVRKGRPVERPMSSGQKFACILEATKSTRLRMEESLPNYHEDHIAGKRDNPLQHYNLVHKFLPMPQAMKIPAAEAAVDEEWEELDKIPAWNLTKVRSKSEVVDEARTKGATVHFASLMDICHLKNAELEAKHQKYKGRVVLRGDIVKDDSGSYAVFTEQGSSASQMTAAEVMDIISRLSGCAGQAADAVSAHTQVKLEDAPKLLEKQNRNVQTFGSVYHDTSTTTHMAQIMVHYGRHSRFLERNLYGHLLAGLLRERQFEKILLKYGWEKVSNCLLVHREKRFFLSVKVDDIILAGKKQHINPKWKVQIKKLIRENQHHSLIMCTWDVLRDNVK